MGMYLGLLLLLVIDFLHDSHQLQPIQEKFDQIKNPISKYGKNAKKIKTHFAKSLHSENAFSAYLKFSESSAFSAKYSHIR